MNAEFSDVPVLKRSADYQFVERLAHLEGRIESLDQLEVRISKELEDLRYLVLESTKQTQQIMENQEIYQPTLKSINRIIDAGLVLRWIVLFTIGTLAAVGTVATAWDAIRSWIK